MFPESWVAIAVVAIPAFSALIVSIINRNKLNEIHVLINSRLSELVAASSRAGHAEGVVIGGANATDIQIMINQAISKAMSIPPALGSESLAAMIENKSPIVAISVPEQLLEVASLITKIKEHSPDQLDS